MTIVYSLIARSPCTVLCSHQISAGRHESNLRKMLPNIPTRSDAKTTYTSDDVSVHVVVENGIIYCCCTGPDFGKRRPYAFLAELKDQFLQLGLNSRAQFVSDGELDSEFNHVMATQMERFSNQAPEGDNFSNLRAQVDEVKGVMTQNIEKVLERGERLDDLLDKTTDLEASSSTFKKTARRVHRKMWWKNTKMMILLICVVLVVITVFTLIILFSTGVLPPKSSSSNPSPTPTTTTTTVAPSGK